MTARSLLLCLCVAGACRHVETVGADHLVVTAAVKPDTFSLSRDTGRIWVTVVARNLEGRAVDVDTHGSVRMSLGPYVALIAESAGDSHGLSFGLRIMRYDQSLVMSGVSAGAWTIRFGPREAKTRVDSLRIRDSRLFGHVLAPGPYRVIGSYAAQEAAPVRLVVTP